MFVAYRLSPPSGVGELLIATCREMLRTCADALVPLLFSENSLEEFAACWAFAWIGETHVWAPPLSPNVLDRLFTLWFCSSSTEVRVMAAWAFSRLPLLPREAEPLDASSEVEKFTLVAKERSQLEDEFKERSQLEDEFKERPAVLVAAYYLRSPWRDAELARLVNEQIERSYRAPTLEDLMSALNAERTNPLSERRKSGKRRQRR